MARLPAATRESVPEDQREIFDQLVHAHGGVTDVGPGFILFHVPKLRQLEKAMSVYLRRQTSLPQKIVELAILVAARALDCQYIWNSHAGSAREAGVPDALIDALRDRKEMSMPSEVELAVVSYGQEFFRTHRVSPDAFQTALKHFGRRGLVEMSMILAQYSGLALILNSFECDLRAPHTEPLLPV